MNKQYFQTKLALGSDTTIVLVTDVSDIIVEKLFNDIWLKIYTFERQFSRFIPDSELSLFNQRAGLEVPISKEFKDILSVAKQLSIETKGLFNPFILPALHRAGYKNSFVEKYKLDEQADYSDRKVANAQKILIKDNFASIPFGTAIDLGGCGKGYLADLVANEVLPGWLHGFWLSFGGDIVGGGLDVNNQPWEISVVNAFDKITGDLLTHDSGARFAVATSGTTIRRGMHEGNRWHHLIDPSTLEPSTSDMCMATVHCDSTLYADILASCSVILGLDKATEFLRGFDIDAAYFQATDGRVSKYKQNGKVKFIDEKKKLKEVVVNG